MSYDKPIVEDEANKTIVQYKRISPNNTILKSTNVTATAEQRMFLTWLYRFDVAEDNNYLLKCDLVKLLLESLHQRSGDHSCLSKHCLDNNLSSLKSLIKSMCNADSNSKNIAADQSIRTMPVLNGRGKTVKRESVRFDAGSDYTGRRKCNECCNTQRASRSIWERNENNLPSLRTAFQNQNPENAQRRPAAQQRSRIPVPLSRLPPRRQDRPVQLFVGSRLPVPFRHGNAAARIPRPAGPPCRDGCASVRTRRTQSLSRNRRCARDDVRRWPEPRGGNGCGNACDAMRPEPRGGRRGARDIPAQPNCGCPCRRGTFTMSGTIELDDDVAACPAPECELFDDRQTSAVSGCPHVTVNDSGNSSVPERFHGARDDWRNATGARAVSFGACAADDRPDSCDDDASRPNDCGCPKPDTDSRANERPAPRTMSVDRAGVCSRRRDFTYNRNTH